MEQIHKQTEPTSEMKSFKPALVIVLNLLAPNIDVSLEFHFLFNITV